MMKPLLFQFSLLQGMALFALLASSPTAAQIVPDNTLPQNSVIKNRNDIIEIEGGTRKGNNLFHSFEEFSPHEKTVFFNNAVNIQNILSRVTGSSKSNINGIIKTNPIGNANLFLINPNGIIFGKNASLDINGSFLASTASSIIFGDGFVFSTTPNQTKPLLTVTAPIGLGFGKTPGSITNLSVVTNSTGEDLIGLRVKPNQTLALVGGDIIMKGGFLSTNEGRIEIGSVAGNNRVNLNPININQGWILSYEGIQNFQDVRLSKEALVDTSGERGGDIQIQGKSLTLTSDSSVISATSGSEVGGTLKITTSDSVDLSGGLTALNTFSDGTGTAGNLTIETKNLTIQDGAQIASLAAEEDRGRAGNLTIIADESIELTGGVINEQDFLPSGMFAQAFQGNGGNLTVETGQMLIRDGAQISASTFGKGDAGNVKVTALESIELKGTAPNSNDPSGIFAQVNRGATGNGGNLTINTGQLFALDGAQISTSARNGGQSGKLSINASNSILLSGTSPTATLAEGSSGIFASAIEAYRDNSGKLITTTADAGELNISTGQLIVEKGAKISADNFGTGKGGSVTLNVDRLIIRDGGLVRSGSLVEKGAVSNIRGAGGTLTVNATESVEVIGTGKIGFSPVKSTLLTQAQGTGNAGDLNIFTPNLTVRDGGELNASATGSGEAGNLKVEANSIQLERGTLTAATASGEGGNIKLQVDDLLFLNNNSLISAEATNNANGGNIDMNAGFVFAVPNENSDIIANASEGRGGNINITTQGIFNIEERKATEGNSTNDIDASSEFGLAGTVTINSPDVDPSRKLAQLPNVPVNVEVAQGCQTSGNQASAEFFNTGKGGLAPSPYEPLSSSNIWEDVPTPTQETSNPNSEQNLSTSPDKIVEAQGWLIDEKGNVALVAEVPNNPSQGRCRLH
jgi:filamentous hemagglutinin family protein